MSLLFAAGLFGVAGPAVAATDCSRPLRILAAGDYAPYSVVSEGGTATGVDITLIRKALRRLGCEARFRDMPWPRALHKLEHGELDIVPFASATRERREYAFLSVPYRYEVTGFVVRREDIERYDVETPEELVTLRARVGIHRGGQWGYRAARLIGIADRFGLLARYDSMSQGIKMLARGRIDLMLGDTSSIMAVAERLGNRNKLHPHPIVLNRNLIRFMLSRKSLDAVFAARFDGTIRAIRKTPSYRALFGAMSVPISE